VHLPQSSCWQPREPVVFLISNSHSSSERVKKSGIWIHRNQGRNLQFPCKSYPGLVVCKGASWPNYTIPGDTNLNPSVILARSVGPWLWNRGLGSAHLTSLGHLELELAYGVQGAGCERNQELAYLHVQRYFSGAVWFLYEV
jgi:hypothetical protein